jgi:hypothetical protein
MLSYQIGFAVVNQKNNAFEQYPNDQVLDRSSSQGWPFSMSSDGRSRGLHSVHQAPFKQHVEGWWPVDIRSGTPLGYRMSPDVARYWKEA